MPSGSNFDRALHDSCRGSRYRRPSASDQVTRHLGVDRRSGSSDIDRERSQRRERERRGNLKMWASSEIVFNSAQSINNLRPPLNLWGCVCAHLTPLQAFPILSTTRFCQWHIVNSHPSRRRLLRNESIYIDKNKREKNRSHWRRNQFETIFPPPLELMNKSNEKS